MVRYFESIPFIPQWLTRCRLVKMARIEEAKEIFSVIYEVPPDSQTVHKNIRDIQLSLELGQNVGLYVHISQLFKGRGKLSMPLQSLSRRRDLHLH